MIVRLCAKVGVFLSLIFIVAISQLEAKVVTKQSSECFNKIAGDNDEFLKYRKDFIYLYNLFLNNDIIALESFIDKTAENKELPKYMMLYFNALANYYLGFLTIAIEQNVDESLVYFNQAKDLIDLSLKDNDKFNESLRLASDIYGKIALLSPFTGLSYLSIIDSHIEKSHLINPNNPLLDISTGLKFYATPFLFGGDKDKAKEVIDKAYEACPLFEDTSYRFLWYNLLEDEVNKKTCDFYVKHKGLANIEVFERLIMEIERRCGVLNNE